MPDLKHWQEYLDELIKEVEDGDQSKKHLEAQNCNMYSY